MTGPKPSTRATPSTVPWSAASCRWTCSTARGASGREVDVAQRVEEVGGEREGTRQRGRLRLAAPGSGLEVEVGSGSASARVGIGVLEEQGEELGGAGEPAEGEGAELLGERFGVTRGDDLGDAVDDRVDRDGVAGLEAGDEGAQAELVGAAEADVAAAALGIAALLVQLGVGLDDLGLGDLEHAARRLGGDHPRHRAVDQPDLVAGEVARQLGDAPGHPHLALPAPAHRPRQRQPVLEVEHVGQRVRRGRHPGAAGEGDLAEAEVLHTGRALPAELAQHVAHPARDVTVGPSVGSLEWIAAHAESTSSRATSASRAARSASPAAARRPLASRARRSMSMTPTLAVTTDTDLPVRAWIHMPDDHFRTCGRSADPSDAPPLDASRSPCPGEAAPRPGRPR